MLEFYFLLLIHVLLHLETTQPFVFLDLKNMSKKENVEHYLSKHHVEIYFKDIVELILECKTNNIKIDPSTYMYDYFKSIKNGTNVVFREYSYITATPNNRKSFLKIFWKTFRYLHTNGILLNLKEYHSLLCLLCYDFDLNILQNTFQLILTDDALDCVVSFNDFMQAFQIQFYFNEFTMKCKEIFNGLVIERYAKTDIKSEDISSHMDTLLTNKTETVQSMKYYEDICEIYSLSFATFNQHICPVIPADKISDILKRQQTDISYYEFMKLLSRSEFVNKTLGIFQSDS